MGGNIFPKAYAILILKDYGRIGRITFYRTRFDRPNSSKETKEMNTEPKETVI